MMDMEDIVTVVNGKLCEGLSTAQIEKQMKLGKDTLRKRLNRANYRYDKGLNQYRLVDNTNATQEVITPKNIDVTHCHNTYETERVITQDVENITQKKIELTEEEIEILKVIASNYKKAESNYKFDGDIITRSVRTYRKVLEQFASYCKNNNLSQKDSLAIALMDFMSK